MSTHTCPCVQSRECHFYGALVDPEHFCPHRASLARKCQLMCVQVWVPVARPLVGWPGISSTPRISSDPWKALSAQLHCCPASSLLFFLSTILASLGHHHPSWHFLLFPLLPVSPSASPSITLLPLHLRVLPAPPPALPLPVITPPPYW